MKKSMYGFDPYIHKRASNMFAAVRNNRRVLKISGVPARKHQLLAVHSSDDLNCDDKMSALAFPYTSVKKQRGSGNGGRGLPVRASSCADLFTFTSSQNRKCIRSETGAASAIGR